MKNSRGLMCNGVKIIYQCSDFVVAEKPHNLPTAPLKEGENNTALEEVLRQFEAGRSVLGKKTVEHGLVHRLDTATHGLFVVALNQPAFDSLWGQQQQGAFKKIYTAFCSKQKNPDFPVCNFVTSSDEKITSLFRYYGKGRSEVRPVAYDEKCGKAAAKKTENGEYTTIIEKIEEFNGFLPQIYENSKIYSVQCALNKGFKHQIRAHLAWAGLPIIGDFLYCPAYKQYAARQNIAENFLNGAKAGLCQDSENFQNIPLQLHATQLHFLHPSTGEPCNFSIDPKPSF